MRQCSIILHPEIDFINHSNKFKKQDMKRSTKIILLIIGVILLMQFIKPKKPEQNLLANDMQSVPQDVRSIFQKSCFDCHSSSTNIRWYDNIFPVNFMVAADINQGRKALNFSKWDSLATPQQNALLYNALNKILSGEMPLPSYTAVHKDATLKGDEIALLKKYAISRPSRKLADSIQISSNDMQFGKWITGNNAVVNKKIAAAPNGISYVPDYRNWNAISTTDRFDNGTMRIIFANKIAVEAIKNHQINPWPNGSILAKAAWKQELGKDGIARTGEFVQVEFMMKDAEKYKNTQGWGWARWKGENLKPYGVPGFEQECVSCHRPVRDNDNVFTPPLDLKINLYNLIKN